MKVFYDCSQPTQDLHLDTKLVITLCTLPVSVAAAGQDSACPHTEGVRSLGLVPLTAKLNPSSCVSGLIVKMSNVHTQSGK